jgi:hypothetical protein
MSVIFSKLRKSKHLLNIVIRFAAT